MGDCSPSRHLPLRQQTLTPYPFVLDGQGLAWAPGRVDRWSTGPGDPGLVRSLDTLCDAGKSSPPPGLCLSLYNTEPVILASQELRRIESGDCIPGSAQSHAVSSHQGELGLLSVTHCSVSGDHKSYRGRWRFPQSPRGRCALGEGVFGCIVGPGLLLVTCRWRGWASSSCTG